MNQIAKINNHNLVTTRDLKNLLRLLLNSLWENKCPAVLLPSLRGEKLKAVVALDATGSTTDALPMFFGELSSLLASFGDYELALIQCDATVQAVEHFSNVEPVPADRQWKAKGFGGTDFRPVFKYLNEHPEQEHSELIFFTDGYGTAPANPPPYPVLWLLCGNGDPPASWGTTIRL